MFDFILKNYTLLWVVLILGVTMAIISIILGLTMQITSTMIASIVLCVLGILFIGFGAYNLMYHPKLEEHLGMVKDHLKSSSEGNSSSSSESPAITESPAVAEVTATTEAKGGYYYY